MEINLFTCEFEGEGINIQATIKKLGKPIIKFNCQTKYMDRALENIEEMINCINFETVVNDFGYDIKELKCN